jgi:hypothetical protein
MIIVALESRTSRYFMDAAARADTIADPLDRLRWVATYLAAGVSDDAASRVEWLVWTEYWRAALRDDDLRDSSAILYTRWIDLVRRCIVACVESGLCSAPDDVEAVAAGAVAMGDGLGIQLSLRHPAMTRTRAGAVVRTWLAAQLGCSALVDAPNEGILAGPHQQSRL